MTVFDWCRANDHANCARSFQKFTIDPKANTVVWSDDTVFCECRKRGCGCYVKPADRPVKKKTTKPRRRKK